MKASEHVQRAINLLEHPVQPKTTEALAQLRQAMQHAALREEVRK